MDIDMVTAICPNGHILLDETGSTFEPDLEAVPNAKFVSYGFAEPENPAFFNNVAMFEQQDGIAMVVAAGDSGFGAEYPASSQLVTAVGGTSLVQDGDCSRLDRVRLVRYLFRLFGRAIRAVLATGAERADARGQRRLSGCRPGDGRCLLRSGISRAAGA